MEARSIAHGNVNAMSSPVNPICVAAHKHSTKHRVEVEASTQCACFFCFKKFTPASIKTWTEGGQTALCPSCGMDAVIGSASSHRLDDTFLRQMHGQFFAYRSK
jgi:hypothetical protein